MAACGAGGAGDPDTDPNPGRGPSPALPWALAALVLSAQRRGELAGDAAAAGLEGLERLQGLQGLDTRQRHAALLQRIRGRLLLQQGRPFN